MLLNVTEIKQLTCETLKTFVIKSLLLLLLTYNLIKLFLDIQILFLINRQKIKRVENSETGEEKYFITTCRYLYIY